MQSFSEKVTSLWSGWEIRLLVLVSLSLQIILVLLGSRRKYIARSWISILVWLSYLAADSVATIALGNLATGKGDDSGATSPKSNKELQAFWAPFLLLHLGGPDTITAYSLEDNELWLRHFLGLIVQVGVAFYVFLQFWGKSVLSFLAIPIFVAAIIKYGERTFVLRSSSMENFKDFLLSGNDPSPDLVKIMESDIKEEVRLRKEDSHPLVLAYFLFRRFAHLFAGLLLNSLDGIELATLFSHKSTEEAFNLIAIELGFMYDVLYTKATILYSRLGIVFRCISFLSSVCALVVFSFIVDTRAYSLIDISMTYLLLAGAVAIEVYSFILLFFSDWTKLYLTKHRNKKPNSCVAFCLSHSLFTHHKRWSRFMGQFNLIRYCIKDMPITTCMGVQKLLCITKFLERYMFLTWEDVNVDLQEAIFNHLKEKIRKYTSESLCYDIELRKKVLAQRGDQVLQERYELGNRFNWCTVDIEFEYNLLVWHLAADICYYDDFDKHGGAHNIDPKCKISHCLSDYMLYLLVLCPSVMPKGIGELRFKETCTNFTNLFGTKRFVGISNKRSQACKLLRRQGIATFKRAEKKDETLSVLRGGCDLANQLQALESENGWSYQRKWEMISEVWVEMLTYAANQSGWIEHVQQFKKGGELLTHVRLLMAHLGLSEQYRSYGWQFDTIIDQDVIII